MSASAPASRAWLAVIGSVACFALLIERAGLIPAVIATVFVASRGSADTTVGEALLCGVGIALVVSVLFVVLLNQPFTLLRLW